MLEQDYRQDDQLESQVLRRVTWRILPVLILAIVISYIDRVNLGILAVPLSRDLHLSGAAFGLAAGLFYVGYLVFAIPSNIGLIRFGARWWLSLLILSWGVLTLCLATIQTTLSLHLLRMLLGAAEAGFYPGVLYYLTLWYPKRAIGKAYSTYSTFTPLGLIFGALITAALLSIKIPMHIADWRFALAIEAVPAILLGVYVVRTLPDGPDDAKWLTPEQKQYLIAQLAEDRRKVESSSASSATVRSLLGRVMLWTLSVLYFAMYISFWVMTYFMPKIIQERFHVDPAHAGFLSAVPWICACIITWVVGKSSAVTRDKRWHMFFGLLMASFGLWLSAVTLSAPVALVGMCLCTAGILAVTPLFWTMPAALFHGAASAVGIAIINSLGNTSGLVGPWVVGSINDLTGNSRTSLLVMSVVCLCAAILSLVLCSIVSRQQKATPNAGVASTRRAI